MGVERKIPKEQAIGLIINTFFDFSNVLRYLYDLTKYKSSIERDKIQEICTNYSNMFGISVEHSQLNGHKKRHQMYVKMEPELRISDIDDLNNMLKECQSLAVLYDLPILKDLQGNLLIESTITIPDSTGENNYVINIDGNTSMHFAVNNRLIELSRMRGKLNDYIMERENIIRQAEGEIKIKRVERYKEIAKDLLTKLKALHNALPPQYGGQFDFQPMAELLADLISNPEDPIVELTKEIFDIREVIKLLREENNNLQLEVKKIDDEIKCWEEYKHQVLIPMSSRSQGII